MKLSEGESENLDAVKNEMAAVGSYLAGRDYHPALAGNISARISENLLICTRHGANKHALTFDDLVVCDLSGNKRAGKGDPTSELEMHRTAYLMRADVRAVVHIQIEAAVRMYVGIE